MPTTLREYDHESILSGLPGCQKTFLSSLPLLPQPDSTS